MCQKHISALSCGLDVFLFHSSYKRKTFEMIAGSAGKCSAATFQWIFSTRKFGTGFTFNFSWIFDGLTSLSHLYQLLAVVLVYFLRSDCSCSHNPVFCDERAGPSWVCASVSFLIWIFLSFLPVWLMLLLKTLQRLSWKGFDLLLRTLPSTVKGKTTTSVYVDNTATSPPPCTPHPTSLLAFSPSSPSTPLL